MTSKLPLPSVALLDTGVAARAFGDRPSDPRSKPCADVVKAMVAVGSRVLIAAPTIAEMLRGAQPREVPRVRGIQVVAFDDQAARILGEKFPESTLVEMQRATQQPLAYYKYDALIVATALRYGASCIVHIDTGIGLLATRVGLNARAPEDLAEAQLTLVE